MGLFLVGVSKKGKRILGLFKELLFANNIYLKQISMRKLNSLI
jgi:hypothetical protein